MSSEPITASGRGRLFRVPVRAPLWGTGRGSRGGRERWLGAGVSEGTMNHGEKHEGTGRGSREGGGGTGIPFYVGQPFR